MQSVGIYVTYCKYAKKSLSFTGIHLDCRMFSEICYILIVGKIGGFSLDKGHSIKRRIICIIMEMYHIFFIRLITLAVNIIISGLFIIGYRIRYLCIRYGHYCYNTVVVVFRKNTYIRSFKQLSVDSACVMV